jgi:hypothetical protein
LEDEEHIEPRSPEGIIKNYMKKRRKKDNMEKFVESRNEFLIKRKEEAKKCRKAI